MSKIRFSSDILKRLGEELNPGIDKSILELVKNSYDADALSCLIDIKKKIHDKKEIFSLTIIDDGNGMTPSDITNGWLVLGHSQKTKNKTPLGRIPAGSKGLGRLAALRMGTKVELSTVSCRDLTKKNSLTIDWIEYDKNTLVDDVELEIIESSINNGKKGSKITISNIEQPITENDIKKLARELILLSDPFGDTKTGFNPVLKSDEFKDLEELVENRYFDEAKYHVIANLIDENTYNVIVTDWKNDVLFSTDMDLQPPYKTVPFKFELWIFVLNSNSFVSSNVSITEVRNWLKTFGGIFIYQNDIRVAPYGDAGNDWLDLNLQRAKDPEERPSTNTVIGRVIVNENESFLHQKTDRSGYIENEFFTELKRFCTDTLDWVATQRLAIAEKIREQRRVETPKDSDIKKEAVIKLLTSDNFDQEKAKIAFSNYETAKQNEIDTLKKEILLYRTLSTAGIEAATFAHEMQGEHIKNIFSYIQILNNLIINNENNKHRDKLITQVEKLRTSMDALRIPSIATLAMIKHEKRRTERIDIQKTISNIVNDFSNFYKTRDTVVKIIPNPIEIYMFSTISSIECIIVNLITNSLTALEKISDNRLIEINFDVIDSSNFTISVSDNGLGIQDIDLNSIWLPGKTTKPDGTGLGLTIVKDTVMDLGGICNVISNGRLHGAEFVVTLPRL